MKKFLLSLFVVPLFAMELQRIDDHNIMKLSGTRNAELYRDTHGFQVNQDGQTKRIPSHRLTAAVRELKKNPEAMDYFLKNNGYLKLTQNQDGEYALDADGKIIGGGVGGANAGFWIGKILTHAVVQTGIHLATAGVFVFCPPAAPVFYSTAQAVMAVPAESASNVVGLGCGLVGAAATGPV